VSEDWVSAAVSREPGVKTSAAVAGSAVDPVHVLEHFPPRVGLSFIESQLNRITKMSSRLTATPQTTRPLSRVGSRLEFPARWVAILAVVLFLPASLGAAAASSKFVPESVDDLRAIEQQVKSGLSIARPAVVAIQVGDSVGSGVVVSPDGLVLTAAHVGDRAGRDVRFIFPDGSKARGKTLGGNHALDAGLMQITDSGKWPHVEMAASGDARSGDWVLTLGHPAGWDPERPMVVRLGRLIRTDGEFLQSDCTITAGDSGGGLFDLEGRLVAIHSYVRNSTTENYHVPMKAYRDAWERLLKGDVWGNEPPPPRPWVGTRGVDDPDGCLLEYVDETGPGYAAGLRVGDIVMKVNDILIEGADSYRSAVAGSKIGAEVRMTIRREGKDQTLTVKVGERRRR